MSIPTHKELLSVALEAATLGGRHTLNYFNRGVAVEIKADHTPVTQADREAEQIIRDYLLGKYPTHSILGEEYGSISGDPDYQWIIDPIDGTKSFVHGVPLFATLVGLQIRNEPTVGVIFAPALSEVVAAATGEGCWWNGHACRVSEVDDLSKALVCTSDAMMSMERSDAYLDLVRRCKYSRTWGDAYGYLLVATGRCEIMIDAKMNPWDVCALIPVIEESGGTCTSWRGDRSINGGDLFATNARLYKPVAEALREG